MKDWGSLFVGFFLIYFCIFLNILQCHHLNFVGQMVEEKKPQQHLVTCYQSITKEPFFLFCDISLHSLTGIFVVMASDQWMMQVNSSVDLVAMTGSI